MDTVEEGELGPSKGNKQAKHIQDRKGRRSNSVDNREEALVAQVRRSPRTWSPILEVDGSSHLMPRLGIIAGGMLA